jgi:hypothetical protein
MDFQDRFIAILEGQSSGSDIGIFEFEMSQGGRLSKMERDSYF